MSVGKQMSLQGFAKC